MRLTRPQGAATNSEQTTGVRRRLGAGAVRLLSVTAIAAATCSFWAGAASAATSAPAAGTATTTTITNTDPGRVLPGDPYTIDVTVTGAGGTPTGKVTVAPSDATLPSTYTCSNNLSAAGTMSCQVTPGAGTFGDVTYTATYAGDGTFAGSTSGTFTLAVPETTTTSVSPATATTGEVTLEATVIGQAKGNISADANAGSVTFYNGDTVIKGCNAVSTAYDGGGANIAKCAATLAPGSYPITAKYSGDLNNQASSGSETLTVAATPPPAKHATKTKGSAKPRSTKVDRVVKLSATVTGDHPTGKVTFIWRGHVVCSARLSHGKAHCSVVFLKSGTYRIRAYYAGNSTHKASRSGVFDVKVKR